jgi:hypothetical protein
MADHDTGYKWLAPPALDELKRTFATWMWEVLLPARLPGIEMPKRLELQEIKSMLAERVMEWTENWKQQGLEQGLERATERLRHLLLANLEERFGPLLEETRSRVQAIASLDDLAKLISRQATAPSLDSLGLA